MEEESVRIAVVADTHLIGGPDGGRFAAHLSQVQAEIRDVDAAFTLAAGDLSDSGSPDEFALFRKAAEAFPAPVLCVPGNHDVGGKGARQDDLARRVAIYENAIGPTFYCQFVQGMRVIGVNTSLFESGLPREAEQWSMLDAELTPSHPSILLMHYPPFLEAPDEPDDPYWNLNSGPRSRLLSLVNESTVRAVISGHIHRPLIRRWRGVPLITVPPVSFGLPPRIEPEGWALVTIPARGPVRVEMRSIAPIDPSTENGGPS